MTSVIPTKPSNSGVVNLNNGYWQILSVIVGPPDVLA